MRCHLEKPRSTVTSWRGLINDPDIDSSFKINKGLRLARSLFGDLTANSMPLASEMLDTIAPLYLTDLLSVGEVGSRTTESQLHRELASSLPFPVGFSNGTDGTLGVAIDAINASKHQYHFLSMTIQALAAIVTTDGNDDCFIVLRNFYDEDSLALVKRTIAKANLRVRLMVDCSHGNSLLKYRIQSQAVTDQISVGDTEIMGMMLKSNIYEEIPRGGRAGLKHGISIIDACIGWEETEMVLETLAISARQRREVSSDGQVKDNYLWSGKVIPEPSEVATSSFANDRFIHSGEKLVMDDVDDNGFLQTSLGELTPPRERALFNSRKITRLSSFGQIWLRPKFEEFFKSIPDYSDSIKVQAINPEVLGSVGRPGRRKLMEKLAEFSTSICVVDAMGNHPTESITCTRVVPKSHWRP